MKAFVFPQPLPLALPLPRWHTCIPTIDDVLHSSEAMHKRVDAIQMFSGELRGLSDGALVDLLDVQSRAQQFLSARGEWADCLRAREVRAGIEWEMADRFRARVQKRRRTEKVRRELRRASV